MGLHLTDDAANVLSSKDLCVVFASADVTAVATYDTANVVSDVGITDATAVNRAENNTA